MMENVSSTCSEDTMSRYLVVGLSLLRKWLFTLLRVGDRGRAWDEA
jgi:hypothetical protein